MATLRAKTIKYPGSHGLNTVEATLGDEVTRFAAIATNGVVDSLGKLASRKDFIKQTVGFSNTIKALYAHRNNDATETIFSAAAGVVYSGTTTLTSRFDYQSGSQIVDVGGAKTAATATGLSNGTQAYTIGVVINGGASQPVSVTGASAQTYATLITEINADLTGASCALVGGNLKFVSGTTGASSTIAITDGVGSAALLASLTNFVAIRTATAGTAAQENWQFASLSSKMLMAQAGQAFTVLNETTFAVESIVGQPWTSSPNVVIAAYGRAWAADDAASGNRHTLWWSNLLDGKTWNSGDAGNKSLINVWPRGQDSIVAVAAAFSRIVVFGRKSILLFTMPADNDPATMALTDTVDNIGCVARDSVVTTDTGIYFLSDNGVYRIDRLGQTTSLMTMPPISGLYNDDVLTQTAAETAVNIRGGYYPTEGWYVLSFPTPNITFCVHTRKTISVGGADRPLGTKWTNSGRPFFAFAFDKDANWFSGGVNGIHKYSGFTPDGASNAYTFTCALQWHPFEDESRLKHAKSVTLVLEAASGQTGTFEWLVDYKASSTRSNAFTCSAIEFAENPGIGHVSFPIGGSFSVIQPSMAFPINGNKVTLHQMRLYATPGAVKNG